MDKCVQWNQDASQTNSCVAVSFDWDTQGPAGGSQCWLKWSVAEAEVISHTNSDSAVIRTQVSDLVVFVQLIG